MAIDTEDKRRSVIGILPIADGTISGVDKQHVAGFYRGIPAAVPVVTPYPLNMSIVQSKEYSMSIVQSKEYSMSIVQSKEYSMSIVQSGGLT